MTVTSGSFSATDRTRDPEEQFAEIRQKVVDSLHQTLESAKHGSLFPTFLVEAIENEIWKHPRKLTYDTAPPMELAEFIKKPYPRGLGTSRDAIEKLIAGDDQAIQAWHSVGGSKPVEADAPVDLLTRAGCPRGIAPECPKEG